MQPDTNNGDRAYDILVHGIERKGLTSPKRPLTDRNYTLVFEDFRTTSRYNDFDGLIVFQGTFEEYGWRNGYEGRFVVHRFDSDQLDRRKKELALLLKAGGFVCFVLCEPFMDMHNGIRYESTDLCKVYLNSPSFYRKNYSSRITHLSTKMDEFARFFDIYGAASSHFDNYNEHLEMRALATVRSDVVGMTMGDSRFFVPSLIPENIPHRIEEYFKLLAEALTSCRNKLILELPDWINSFRFTDEMVLMRQRSDLMDELKRLEHELTSIRRLKAILLLDGARLVEEVANALQQGLGLVVGREERYREDLTILDPKGQALVVAEIKGTNRGVKREHINQADSHRERAGLAPDFPTLLIMNTHIKSARRIDEKDVEIAAEQIRHAYNNNVLIIRTLDLIRLIEMIKRKHIGKDELLEMLTTNAGWLHVSEDTWEVHQGDST